MPKRMPFPQSPEKKSGKKRLSPKEEKCLFVYPVGEWEKRLRINQLPTGSLTTEISSASFFRAVDGR